MLEDFLVWLALAMLQIAIGWVRLELFARLEMCEVALHVAGCATATRSAESDV